MPKCGSQCYLCDLPIRFDTYKGCSHGCKYCFAKKFKDINTVEKEEGVNSLKSFIEGKRDLYTNWCDWDIPIHWGGMSDPFQPCEKIHKYSLECLKLLKETQYPFVVSTKGKIIAEEPYLSLLSECNCVIQISMVCDKYDKLEQGAPPFEERLKILEKVSKNSKRTIVRIQPYMCELYKDVYNNLSRFADAGAYGVIVEGMKFDKKKPGLETLGNDFVYPYKDIKPHILGLRDEAHNQGLKFYSGENRTRRFGDSLTCCGIDGLEGFIGNYYNLNHILNDDKVEPKEKMEEIGTASCFIGMGINSVNLRRLKKTSFANEMIDYYKKSKNNIDKIFGINYEKL